MTSATGGFTDAMVGSVIKIASGTNFTAGWYEITARASTNSVTLDRNPTNGSNASSGTGRVGGAVSHASDIATIVVAGNRIYIKATGTYTRTTTLQLSVDGTDGLPIEWIGYTATRTDNGQATFQATASITTGNPGIIEFRGYNNTIRNLTFDGNSLAYNAAYIQDNHIHVYNCKFMNALRSGLFCFGHYALVERCLATANGSGLAGSGGFDAGSARGTKFVQCVAKSNSAHGFYGGALVWTAKHCLAVSNGGSGFYGNGNDGGPQLHSCNAISNTGDGLKLDSANQVHFFYENCIFASNGGYGVNSVTTNYATHAAYQQRARNNAFYNNTSGLRFQMPTGATDITLTADPFVGASSSDYALNDNYGGGASLRGAGLPGGFGLVSSPETSTALQDVGAVVGNAPTSTTDMFNLWREYCNERDTTVVPNAVVARYLNSGLQALNRRVRYHWTEDTTSITLVSGTQEYALPRDHIEVFFVEHNGKALVKRDIEDWRRKGEAWRTETGTPVEWAHYGNKIVFRPIPDAAAVAADSTPTFRYVSTPGDISTFGPAQLATQDYRIAVYYGVAEWAAAHPDSALAVQRLKEFGEKFDTEAEGVKAYYHARSISR